MKDRSFMLAKKRNVDSSSAEAAIGLRLDYRPPLRFSELLAFFRGRALAGVEVVDDASYARTARIIAGEVIAPCHRVVGADGSLTGFGGGIDMKVKLLEHEGVDVSCFYRPKRGTAIDPASWSR